MERTAYRDYHESQMRDNTGSTFFHTFACIGFSVASTLLCCLLTREIDSKLARFCIEYMVIVLPLIYIHTFWHEYVEVAAGTLLLLWFLAISSSFVGPIQTEINNNEIFAFTVIRGLTYLISCYAISAVDYHIFPRHLAKTEQNGYSFMDTGVGLFVLCSGCVHKTVSDNTTLRTLIMDHRKLFLMLLVLGLARTIATQELEYPQHVTEYGVHWNFFYTLAVSKLLSMCLLKFLNPLKTIHIFFFTANLHEVFLCMGLESWVFSSIDRTDFLSANREGISSCLGFAALYILGVYTKEKFRDRSKLHWDFVKVLIVLILLHFWYIQFKPTSRVLANFGYTSFLGINWFAFLLVIIQTEKMLQPADMNNSLVLIRQINKNGLIFFLIANLATGFVNLTQQTFLLSEKTSIVMINCFMFFVVISTVILNYFGIKF